MTTFLERILEVKHSEIRALEPHMQNLEQTLTDALVAGTATTPRGFANAIATGTKVNVVAEVKRASPSKGLIAPDFDPVKTAIAYESAGACAVSVLTDATFFQGSLADLSAVREHIALPVLRKDFIIDESQILEARVAGADAVLLIVAALSTERLVALSRAAKAFGLDVLIEVHSVAELEPALLAEPSVLGVNNRNLHTFEVSLDTTNQVLAQVPQGTIAISESGIHQPADAMAMATTGIHGLLVGESLMRAGVDGIPALLRSFQVPKRKPGDSQ